MFLPERVLARRRELFLQMQAGTISKTEASHQVLEVDPDNALALYVVAMEQFQDGQQDRAAELCWRALNAQPTRTMGYVGVANALTQGGIDPELGRSMGNLALRRLVRDPLSPVLEDRWMVKLRESLGPEVDREFSIAAADALSMSTRNEPQRVTDALQAYRLVQEVIDRPEEGIAPEIVDRILCVPACAPLLVGVLRDWAREEFDDGAAAEAALGLLGEIGDPSVLPQVVEFKGVNDEGMAEAAVWAAYRIAVRHPDEVEQAAHLTLPSGVLTVYDFCCYDMSGEEEVEQSLPKPGRNDPCWCGSGKKYKKCHLAEDEARDRQSR